MGHLTGFLPVQSLFVSHVTEHANKTETGKNFSVCFSYIHDKNGVKKKTESRPQWKTHYAIRRDRLTILLWIKFVLSSHLYALSFQVFTILSLLCLLLPRRSVTADGSARSSFRKLPPSMIWLPKARYLIGQ